MCTMKHFRSAIIAVLAMASLFFLPGCPSPSSTSTCTCPSPNPLVTFDALNSDGFSVTPDTMTNVTLVVIEVSGSSGAPKTTFNGQPGVATLIDLDTTYHRPLLLKFAYKSASGDTLANDELRIDDSESHGVTLPDMDVVMGVTNFPSCPSTTQDVTVSTAPNGVSTFNWNTGDAFEVILTYNSTQYKFRVHPVAGVGDNAGTTTIFENPSHTCLTDITTQVVSSKEIAITSISNNCTVRAWNDGTARVVTIKHPSSATISVRK